MLFSKTARSTTLLAAAALTIGVSAVSTVVAAPAQAYGGTWGAIALGNHERAYSIVTGYPSKEAAEAAAVSKCGYTDCVSKINWDADRSDNKRCAAAAVTARGHWGWSWGNTWEEAEALAIDSAGWGAGVQISGCDTITRGPQN
ncbi:DUF4189 domain-containing protein [Nocardia huaxiensis]|uniref:DUF4189 domain-containing protein n=1 Tax=Nocardia huaxiensis TaxID=2755382 RepID=A0A7D6ZY85_9NOCA|nr:DUF4189 domain-containing protein [Nocardia huaxiensis]QLY31469.1 DUF4189 domain-containing protein [Nocardia huaxiensis]UFS95019.1 DUF4189 domain-containing protein [Nocardia huaxiensis]